jgi:hypothetical protein
MSLGLLKILGEVLLAVAAFALLLIPDPISKMVGIWRFFRGE